MKDRSVCVGQKELPVTVNTACARTHLDTVYSNIEVCFLN